MPRPWSVSGLQVGMGPQGRSYCTWRASGDPEHTGTEGHMGTYREARARREGEASRGEEQAQGGWGGGERQPWSSPNPPRL